MPEATAVPPESGMPRTTACIERLGPRWKSEIGDASAGEGVRRMHRKNEVKLQGRWNSSYNHASWSERGNQEHNCFFIEFSCLESLP